MVCAGGEGERPRISEKDMAMGPERSKALHNFNLPCLKWGNQRYLRCMKQSPPDGDDEGDRRSPVPRTESSPGTRRRELERRRKRDWKPEDGIEAVREKLLFDLKTAADKMKDAIFRKDVEEEEEEEEIEEEEAEEMDEGAGESPATAAEGARPWNLRTRRAACKAPIGGGGKGLRIEERKQVNSLSPLRSDNNGGVRSPRLRGGVGGVASEKKEERTRLTVPLSRKEVEEDFMAVLGQRPPRRPKKRPRTVQKQWDSLSPAFWLSEVTLDAYKVPESAENGKR